MTISLQDVGLAVKRLQWRHHRAANQRLAALGLSLAQWDVLRHLDAQPDASLHDLAVLTFQTDQSMGALAGRMAERGLLARLHAPGRAVRHELTPEGRRLRKAGSAIIDAVLQESVGQLSQRDLATLHKLLIAAAS
ncbi:MAG: MarR family winged helix-turn-helix transcriptional regulator [Solirubrobacteraceae bacterium]